MRAGYGEGKSLRSGIVEGTEGGAGVGGLVAGRVAEVCSKPQEQFVRPL